MMRAAYVTQDDTLFPSLTVRENLTFAAAVKLPSSLAWAEKQRRVEEVGRKHQCLLYIVWSHIPRPISVNLLHRFL